MRETDYQKETALRFGVCTVIVLVNLAVFLCCDWILTEPALNRLYEFGALSWQMVLVEGEYYRLLTYLFLHAGINHLANNMIVVLFLGNAVEQALGKWRFFFLYFSTGIIAGIVSIVYNMINGYSVHSVGASGAGFGIVGALVCILLMDRSRRGSFAIKRAILFIAISLYSGFSEQGIDHAAHIGGILAGVAITALLLWRGRRRGES